MTGWVQPRYRFATFQDYTPYFYFGTLGAAREEHSQKREVGDVEVLCSTHGWTPAVFDWGDCVECVREDDEGYFRGDALLAEEATK